MRDKTMARGVGCASMVVGVASPSMVPFLPLAPRDTAVLLSPSRHHHHCLFYVHCPLLPWAVVGTHRNCTLVAEYFISSPEFW